MLKKLSYLIILACIITLAIIIVLLWHEYDYKNYSNAKLVYGERYEYLYYA